jgi:3-phosphoshikimate 1-carboxyvinyltransferase
LSYICTSAANYDVIIGGSFLVTGAGDGVRKSNPLRGDHRLAMLGAVAGLASREGVEVLGMEAAAVSYPEFTKDLALLCS